MMPQALDASEYPEMTALLMNYLLLQLGGQVTLHASDLASMSHEYADVRFAYNEESDMVTLTLRTRSHRDIPPEYRRM